jgi:pimeloyl-ACP methyl ester carboxylesterase
MPYSDNSGVKTYYEIIGTGPPLILYHALGWNHNIWKINGYVDGLKKDNRLILLDARGYGKSSKPHNPQAYTLDKLVSDVTNVLNNNRIEKAHFMGYSLGAHVAWGIGKYASDRFNSLIIGGEPPSVRELDHQLDEDMEAYVSVLRQGVDVMLEAFKGWGIHLNGHEKNLYREHDIEAELAFIYRREQLDFKEQIETSVLPILIYCGDKDPNYDALCEVDELLTNSRLVTLAGCDHLTTERESHSIIPHVKEFLKEHAPR